MFVWLFDHAEFVFFTWVILAVLVYEYASEGRKSISFRALNLISSFLAVNALAGILRPIGNVEAVVLSALLLFLVMVSLLAPLPRSEGSD